MQGTLDTDTVDRFIQEADICAELDGHDHIVSLHDWGAEPLPWLAMEYINVGYLGEQTGEMCFDQKLWTAIATVEGV